MGTQAPSHQNSYDSADTDEKLAKQKAIDGWLPITSARNAKCWYSASDYFCEECKCRPLAL